MRITMVPSFNYMQQKKRQNPNFGAGKVKTFPVNVGSKFHELRASLLVRRLIGIVDENIEYRPKLKELKPDLNEILSTIIGEDGKGEVILGREEYAMHSNLFSNILRQSIEESKKAIASLRETINADDISLRFEFANMSMILKDRKAAQLGEKRANIDGQIQALQAQKERIIDESRRISSDALHLLQDLNL